MSADGNRHNINHERDFHVFGHVHDEEEYEATNQLAVWVYY
jgi:hypothetical protein